ncbi:MAG: D-2-hydroxyacid dehydrogenase [Hyphomicrobiales bacterium]|nr:D-2-hydroxyacid dehydrogenase [Hyphomicrobiales bacterium]
MSNHSTRMAADNPSRRAGTKPACQDSGRQAIMVEVLVFDDDADFYVTEAGKTLPAIRLVAATDEASALAQGKNAEILVAMAHKVTPQLVAAMPHLRFIQALTTGTDHLATLTLPPGIAIASMRGMHGPQMAEVAFLYMLALSRNAVKMHDNQRQATWQRWPQPLLLDKTMVIIGVGAISEALAHRARAFGMRVVGVSDSRSTAADFDEILPRRDLIAAAGRADFLVVLAPLTPATRGMIDAPVFAAMKPRAIFINLARGPVVNEAALIEALRAGRIGGAGLDVFDTEPLPPDSPLWALPNTLVTPHIGGMSDIYARQALPILIDNLHLWQTGGASALRNLVELTGAAS